MKRDGSLSWQTIVVDVAIVRTKLRTLALYIPAAEGPKGFIVLAAETDLSATTPDDFFNDHKHATVGLAPTRHEAEKLGAAYAKKWLKTQSMADKCLCEEIRVTARQNARKSA